MKILNLIITGLFSINAFAIDQKQVGTNLADQIGTTRDALEQIRAKMNNSVNTQGAQFSNPDFIAKANAFNKLAEKAMIQFEKETTQIFKEAQFYVDQLKSIQDSKTYTESQKKVLYDSQLSNAIIVFKDLNTRYQDAIIKLYALQIPNGKIEFKVLTCEQYNYNYPGVSKVSIDISLETQFNTINHIIGNGEVTVKYCDNFNKYDILYKDLYRNKFILSKEVPSVEITSNEFYSSDAVSKILHNYVYQSFLKKDCYSSSCISLYSNHLKEYYDLVSISLNKTAYFFEQSLVLYEKQMELNYSSIFSLREGETLGLPFDISEDDYIKKLREKSMEELVALLSTPSYGFFNTKWNCPDEVAKIKTELCDSRLSCLSQQEESQIISSVNAKNVNNMDKRTQCLTKR